MRLFTAIGAENLSFRPQEVFKKVRVGLEKKEVEARWVPIENYHITLNFLGDIEEERIPEILEAMKQVSVNHQPFDLKIDGMYAFPKQEMGRVIWVGVQNSLVLRSLQGDLERRLRDLGIDMEEREYRPHLTIARLRNPRNLKDALSPLTKHSFGTLSVEVITLYESKQGTGAFPVYTPLEKIRLG